jgi:hypothetical protein
VKKMAASKPRAAKAKAASKAPGRTAPAEGGLPSEVPAAFAPLVARLDERIGEYERQFDRAKKDFAKAVKASTAGGRTVQRQMSLAEHNTEMRVLTAHWTELLWVRRVLQQRPS